MSTPAAPTKAPITKAAFETANQTEIQKMVFTGANFPDEAAVTAYLTERAYSNFVVLKVEDSFLVNGIDESEFVSIAPIAKEEGVTLFVGALRNPEAVAKNSLVAGVPAPAPAPAAAPAAEPTQKGEGAPAVTARVRTRAGNEGEPIPILVAKIDSKVTARKVDSYVAYYDSDSLSIADVLEDAEDGIPVGFGDIHDCFMTALRNSVSQGDTANIGTLCAEFGNILMKLVSLTEGMEPAAKSAVVKSLLTDKVTVAKDGLPAPVTGSPANPGLETTTLTLPAGTVPPSPPTSADAMLALLQTKFDQWTALLNTALAEAREGKSSAQKVNERLTALEQIRQTKKSAEEEEVALNTPSATANAEPQQPVKKTAVQRAQENLLG